MRSPFNLSFSREESHQLLVMMCWIAGIHYVIETMIMGTFSGWNLTYDVVIDGLLDSTSLTIFSSPLIYYFVAKPFIKSARDAKAELTREFASKAEQATRLEATLGDLKQTLTQNEDLRTRLQLSNEKIAEINELTLQRIGADLHDGPAQLLTYSLLRLDKFAPMIETTGGKQGSQELDFMRAALGDTLNEVRNISQGLSLPKLAATSLEETIQLAVALHQEQTGTRVEVVTWDLPLDVPQAIKVCAYRVVQESLSNAYKHARATDQKVVAFLDEWLILEISDKGPGFDPTWHDGDGLGLTGMRARVEALGGTLSINTAQGCGTRLSVQLEVDGPSKREMKNDQKV